MKSEAEVFAALRERYQAPEWAILRGVRNGTGYQRETRTADAIAMSVWPSRGLEVHGFEIKVSRADWVKEKRDPAKAEEIARFCDRWWIVAGEPGLVLAGELPAGWGLLVPKGDKLIVKVEAPKLEAQPISRLFLASIFRSLHESAPEKAAVDAAVARALATERKRVEERDELVLKAHQEACSRELHDLREALAEFENASGIKVDRWCGGQIGEAARLVLKHGPARITEEIAGLAEQAEAIAGSIRRSLAGKASEEEAA